MGVRNVIGERGERREERRETRDERRDKGWGLSLTLPY